jgi:hypothetical protein
MSLTAYFFETGSKEILLIWDSLLEGLQSLTHQKPGQELFYPIVLCRKPIGSLLIKYTSENEIMVPNPTAARSFLLCKKWIWFADIDNLPLSLLHESFSMIYGCRITEKYFHISDHVGSITLFKDILFGTDHVYVQFVLFIENNRLITELWVEPYLVPTGNSYLYIFDTLSDRISQKDSYELSRFNNF